MSTKSKPGDGSHSRGTKGGAMYGGGFAVPEEQEASWQPLMRSLTGLARVMRLRRV